MSGKPRNLIFDPSPDGLIPPVTPGTLLKSSARLPTGCFSISSLVITLILAGASLISTAWLLAEITIVGNFPISSFA